MPCCGELEWWCIRLNNIRGGKNSDFWDFCESGRRIPLGGQLKQSQNEKNASLLFWSKFTPDTVVQNSPQHSHQARSSHSDCIQPFWPFLWQKRKLTPKYSVAEYFRASLTLSMGIKWKFSIKLKVVCSELKIHLFSLLASSITVPSIIYWRERKFEPSLSLSRAISRLVVSVSQN